MYHYCFPTWEEVKEYLSFYTAFLGQYFLNRVFRSVCQVRYSHRIIFKTFFSGCSYETRGKIENSGKKSCLQNDKAVSRAADMASCFCTSGHLYHFVITDSGVKQHRRGLDTAWQIRKQDARPSEFPILPQGNSLPLASRCRPAVNLFGLLKTQWNSLSFQDGYSKKK